MNLIGTDKRVQQLRAAARRLRVELEHPTAEGVTIGSFTDLVETLGVLRACVDLLEAAHPLADWQRGQLADQLALWAGYYASSPR